MEKNVENIAKKASDDRRQPEPTLLNCFWKVWISKRISKSRNGRTKAGEHPLVLAKRVEGPSVRVFISAVPDGT